MTLLIYILCALGLLANGESATQQELLELKNQNLNSVHQYYNTNEEIHDDNEWS